MNECVSFDQQVYTCLHPGWPEDKCKIAEESRYRKGKCVYLREGGRCDNIINRSDNQGENER